MTREFPGSGASMDHQMAGGGIGVGGANDEETKVIYEAGIDSSLHVGIADVGIGDDYNCAKCG